MTVLQGLVAALSVITVACAVAWGVNRRLQLQAKLPEKHELGDRKLEERPEPRAVERVQLVPEPEVQPQKDEPTGLMLMPRVSTPGHRRWVVALTAVAPLVTLGAWIHHRRFVGYHALKGSVAVPSFSEWVRAEVRGSATLGYWHVAGLLPTRASPPVEGRLVVCVHGYTQNATNFMGLERALREAGRPTRALSLGHRLAPMAWYAWRLEQKLRELTGLHPDGYDLVAHSMGGVVLRMVLAEHPDLRPTLRTVVTLGSPHRGTAAARGIPLLPEVRALKRRSALLKDLPHLPELLPHARVVAIAGDADTVVYPIETALAPGAARVVLPGIGHAGLLTEPIAWAAVQEALAP